MRSSAGAGKRQPDPRRRLVDLWLGREMHEPNLDSLRRFHRALAPSSHVVVFVKRRE
jgi:hypothetical protein